MTRCNGRTRMKRRRARGAGWVRGIRAAGVGVAVIRVVAVARAAVIRAAAVMIAVVATIVAAAAVVAVMIGGAGRGRIGRGVRRGEGRGGGGVSREIDNAPSSSGCSGQSPVPLKVADVLRTL